MTMHDMSLAPELAISEWFNTPNPITLAGLRGRPVFLHTFQLLCPGCVAEAIPQLQRLEQVFAQTDLAVIGVHTVFEHHAAMSPLTLNAFLHEYKITSPVGVDLADGAGDVPVTMRRFGLRGTPSSVLIGRNGEIIRQTFGVEADMALGARIALALSAKADLRPELEQQREPEQGCRNGVCAVPGPNEGVSA